MNCHHLMRYFRLCKKSKKGQLPKRPTCGLLVMDNIRVSALLCIAHSQRNPACKIKEALNLGSIRLISVRIKRCSNEAVFAIEKGKKSHGIEVYISNDSLQP